MVILDPQQHCCFFGVGEPLRLDGGVRQKNAYDHARAMVRSPMTRKKTLHTANPLVMKETPYETEPPTIMLKFAMR